MSTEADLHADDIDVPACSVCRAATRPVHVGGNRMRRCRTCGLGRIEADRGSDDYWRRHTVPEEVGERYWTKARRSVFEGALRFLEAEVGRGRLLDLGGGVGYFAECALREGWDAYSLDVSDVAVEQAANRLGHHRSLASVPEALERSFDAVTLWCVIAHLRDPRDVLADAVGAVRPGGRLLLTTPNLRFQVAYTAALARAGRPVDFLAHDHLLHFTTDALRRLLEDVGVGEPRFTYLGVTEDCVADRRLGRWLVPAKRLWNRGAVAASRVGLPLLGSELQVVGTVR